MNYDRKLIICTDWKQLYQILNISNQTLVEFDSMLTVMTFNQNR